ncbi:hypothetical protein [Sinomicrobium weinanense]|uniref:F5/8 type C domain-containing protein n=1 Tax=Sinomicrobium weinanense TaxID=2842200 RepID=A0A926Q5V4_9FLAO|nr:hypothetical protein [Sinomicrobium weinanense]MBC9798551.1 hypothetical protein [Sinomicrobium weinanense]MBU3125976.1 discoidin domain-containing protein [Sinomicrobium weinanense]
MKLKRKYWFKKDLTPSLSECTFQASNDINFSQFENLYSIGDLDRIIIYNKKINPRQKYRFVRFLIPPHNNGNISEMMFVTNKGEKLKGKLISSKSIKDNPTLDFGFDNNVLSFINIKKDAEPQWVGLDFGEKKELSEITFCPRTDKNDIWPGLRYELFYWNSGWKSIEKKIATTHTLDFNSPFSNGLYLLKCLDEGVEERIFTYENEKQVWW